MRARGLPKQASLEGAIPSAWYVVYIGLFKVQSGDKSGHMAGNGVFLYTNRERVEQRLYLHGRHKKAVALPRATALFSIQ